MGIDLAGAHMMRSGGHGPLSARGAFWVVDLDLDRVFDRVHHEMLMARIARRIQDQRVLNLLRAYLNAGVMINGVVVETTEGTPQGGPLSPWLANVLLDDLDRELEQRGHRFIRYADDCNISVRTQRAGEQVLASVMPWIETRLKLRVNRERVRSTAPFAVRS